MASKENNPTCCLCERSADSHFCKCTGAPTLFCLDCSGRHHAKYLRAFHQTMPLAALHQNLEEYQRKSEALTRAIAHFQRNIERVDQCGIEFANLMQTCMDYLHEYRSWWLQQLQTEKEELLSAIGTAIQEATNCLDQGIEPVNPLVQAMWSLPTEELEMFTYDVKAPDMQTLCASWMHCQNNLKSICDRFNYRVTPIPEEVKEEPQLPPSPVPRDLFAAISGGVMKLYDFTTKKTTSCSLPTAICSGYVQVDRTTVLIVGEPVITLDLLTLQVTPLPSLLTPRNHVGAAQVGSTVFAFGGYGGKKIENICEMGGVPLTRWTPLPPMHYARWDFTPCPFQSLIYIVSCDARAVESFSVHTETFTELPVSLPAQLGLSGGSVRGCIE